MWDENLLSFFETGEPGKCPQCGKDSISVVKVNTSYRTSYDFKCSECGASTHIDGIDKNIKLD